jgi:hypothetical protein
VGTPAVNSDNWTPFLPQGFAGVGAAAAIVFFAYIGFDAISTTAEEAKNPQRDLPIGIIASLSICTVLYIAVAAVLTGLVPVAQIDIHAPVADALSKVGFKWGAAIVAIGAVAGITSVLVVMMLGQIRVFFAMSRDHLLSPWLSTVHDKYRHSLCFCPGLYRRRDSALLKTRSTSPIQASLHASRSHSWHAGLLRPHELSPMADLDSIRRLDCYRRCGLPRIRTEAQQASQLFP